MVRQINQLKEKRAALIAEARTVLDASKDGVLSAEDQEKCDNIQRDVDALAKQVRRLEKQLDMERSLEAAPNQRDGSESRNPRATEEYRSAFIAAMRNQAGADVVRTLNVGNDADGGYLCPEQFENSLWVALGDAVAMRRIANVTRASGDRKIPYVTTKPTFAYMAEEQTYSTTDVKFGVKALGAWKAGGIILASEELLQDSVVDVESMLRGLAAEAAAELEEGKFIDGLGVGEPTGILQTATVGKTGAAQADVTYDELMDLQHSIKPGYRSNARWLLKDSTALALRKKKDGNGQYIWQASVKEGEPDRLLGKPIVYSDSMPALGQALKPIAWGDFRGYRIVDRLGIQFRRLNELYAATGQVGFRVTYRNDGKLIDTDAVKVFQNAA